MEIKQAISLQTYNTFNLEVAASHFVEIDKLEQLEELVESPLFLSSNKLILGGGSNLLFTEDFEGLVIKNNLRGKSVIRETDEHVWIRAAAGEVWHDLVTFCVQNKWAGIENLALIPGCVGAAPIQNIGAYGVELKDVFASLTYFNFETKKLQKLSTSDMHFGYRNSVFKNELKGKGIITSIDLKLDKQPKLKMEYGAIQATLKDQGITKPTIHAIYEAVISIRSSKLPNPKEIGNAGSFFKNPELPKAQAEKILHEYPSAPHYIVSDEIIKIPAGWMIQEAGWKGFRDGAIGVHDKQALVLVNHGGGKGKDIKALSEKIQASVKTKFGVDLEAEVNMV